MKDQINFQIVQDFILDKMNLKVDQIITKEDIVKEKAFETWGTIGSYKDDQKFIIRGILISNFRGTNSIEVMLNRVQTPNVKPFSVFRFQLIKK